MNGETSRTYLNAQLEERGKEITMEAGAMLLAALRVPNGAVNPERIEALSSAVAAGTQMIDVSAVGPDEA